MDCSIGDIFVCGIIEFKIIRLVSGYGWVIIECWIEYVVKLIMEWLVLGCIFLYFWLIMCLVVLVIFLFIDRLNGSLLD